MLSEERVVPVQHHPRICVWTESFGSHRNFWHRPARSPGRVAWPAGFIRTPEKRIRDVVTSMKSPVQALADQSSI
jgi:hypothetical protein